MKKVILLIVAGILSLSSCATRKVAHQREKVKLFETSKIQRTAPGDKIYIEFPRTPKERPKSQIKQYKGERGAVNDITFDEQGIITKINTNCPEVNEYEERAREFERKLKLKDTERVFNMDLAKLTSKTIIWITIVISIAWIIRALFARKIII